MSSDYLAQIVVNYLQLFSCQKLQYLRFSSVDFRFIFSLMYVYHQSQGWTKTFFFKNVCSLAACWLSSGHWGDVNVAWRAGHCQQFGRRKSLLHMAFIPVVPEIGCFFFSLWGRNCWKASLLVIKYFWGFFYSKTRHELMYYPQSAWNWGSFFGAKLTILDFSANFKCTLLTLRVWVPELCSMIHGSTGALQSVQERQDPGWGLGNVPGSQQAAAFLQEKVLWALKGKTTKDECV